MKSNPATPVKGVVNRDATVVSEDFLKFYKDSGLEPLAREVGKSYPQSPRDFVTLMLWRLIWFGTRRTV